MISSIKKAERGAPFRSMAQFGRASGLGPEGRESESLYSDVPVGSAHVERRWGRITNRQKTAKTISAVATPRLSSGLAFSSRSPVLCVLMWKETLRWPLTISGIWLHTIKVSRADCRSAGASSSLAGVAMALWTNAPIWSHGLVAGQDVFIV